MVGWFCKIQDKEIAGFLKNSKQVLANLVFMMWGGAFAFVTKPVIVVMS